LPQGWKESNIILVDKVKTRSSLCTPWRHV